MASGLGATKRGGSGGGATARVHGTEESRGAGRGPGHAIGGHGIVSSNVVMMIGGSDKGKKGVARGPAQGRKKNGPDPR
jgi:hypothetical protein